MSSEAYNHQVSFASQSTVGTPATGNYTKLAVTGSTLQPQRAHQDSNRIEETGVSGNSHLVGKSGSGTLDFEFALQTVDDFLKSVIRSAAWTSEVEVSATTISVTASTKTIADSGNGFGSLAAGQWIKITNSDTDANHDILAKIATASAGSITLESPTKAIADESAGNTVTITMGAQLTNAETQSAFSIEENVTDVANTYFKYGYAVCNSFSLDFGVDDNANNGGGRLATASASFMATHGDRATSSDAAGYNAATGNPEVNTSVDTIYVLEGGSDLASTGLTINLEASKSERRKIGDGGNPFDMSMGRLSAGGSITRYFANLDLAAKFEDHTDSSLAIAIKDSSSTAKYMVIEFPRVKFRQSTSNPSAEGSRFQNLDWRAQRHETENVMVRVVKW